MLSNLLPVTHFSRNYFFFNNIFEHVERANLPIESLTENFPTHKKEQIHFYSDNEYVVILFSTFQVLRTE